MRFLLTTLGCKVNQYDGQAISAALERAGLERDDSGDGPAASPVALVVVNTCCVTATAMRKSRQAVRKAVRRAPAAAVLVTGCYSDYDGRRIRAILAELNVPPEKIAVLGHHDDLADRIERFARRLCRGDASPAGADSCPTRRRANHGGDDVSMNAPCGARITASPTSIRTRRNAAVKANMPGTQNIEPLSRFAGRQRAFVKVQDGCDAFCTYCIVPYTRPRVWSRTIDEVLAECRRLVAAGHREIVLCGVFLGAFGRDTAIRRRWSDARSALPELLRRVAGIDGLWRVRLSSLEPGDVTDELLDALAATPAAAPHLHLPLQSGSDPVLRRMNRQYTVEQYRRTVDHVRAALDRPALTTDVIAGFPGETETDFAATLAAARHAGFAKIHAFPFSPVEGTTAWRHRGEAAPPARVKARLAALAELERELAAAYRRRLVGETMEALVEAGRGPRGRRHAMTDRYLTVTFQADPAGNASTRTDDLTGRVVRLRIDRATPAGLAGTLVE